MYFQVYAGSNITPNGRDSPVFSTVLLEVEGGGVSFPLEEELLCDLELELEEVDDSQPMDPVRSISSIS